MTTLVATTPNYGDKTIQRGHCGCGDCWGFTTQESCAPNEILKGYHNCCVTCPQQPTCVTLDMNKCNIGLSSKGENPVVSGRLIPGRTSVLECTFDPSKIDTEEQYNSFISNKFGNVETLNKFYCAQSTTDGCPLDMEGKVQTTCSRMLSSKFPQCKELNSQYN
jgi:hypothetical protein